MLRDWIEKFSLTSVILYLQDLIINLFNPRKILINHCLQFFLGHEDGMTLPAPPNCNPLHGVSFKISYFLTSFYYKVLYISSILAGRHAGVVTFLV